MRNGLHTFRSSWRSARPPICLVFVLCALFVSISLPQKKVKEVEISLCDGIPFIFQFALCKDVLQLFNEMNAKSYSAPFCSDEVENERSAACTYAYYVYGSAAAETASPHSLLRHPLSAMPYRARRVLVTALFILDSCGRARGHYYSLTFLSLRSR